MMTWDHLATNRESLVGDFRRCRAAPSQAAFTWPDSALTPEVTTITGSITTKRTVAVATSVALVASFSGASASAARHPKNSKTPKRSPVGAASRRRLPLASQATTSMDRMLEGYVSVSCLFKRLECVQRVARIVVGAVYSLFVLEKVAMANTHSVADATTQLNGQFSVHTDATSRVMT
jgi:hypothetical protein